MADITHAELVEAGRRWLRRQGCKVILHEPFRAGTPEQPDVIGWRDGVSILLEAKASRSDFLADARKPWRMEPGRGMGDWRIFIAPAGMIDPNELPEGWGLLEVQEDRIKARAGIPLGNCNWGSYGFEADKRAETRMLVSALGAPQFVPKPDIKLRRGIDIQGWQALADRQAAQEGRG